MIHWTTNYSGFDVHRSECGAKVTTKEVESQRFEGVFRFLGKARAAVEGGKTHDCPNGYCQLCWNKAIAKATRRG